MRDILKENILKLKKEKNAIILAHLYEPDEIQEIADYVGDSYYLSKIARDCKEELIIFCGVKFMGESAKILSPQKTVILPAVNAGCPMADMADAEDLKEMTGELYPVIAVSAREGNGIDLLEQTIRDLFYRGEISFNDEVYITNARQKADLVNARESVLKVLESISLGLPEDFYSIDLMSAYEALGAILGESVGEDLVNEIFSRFCMGK